MTISGMTGFAREDGAHGDWTWTVEARSVNGRGLDVKFRGPQGFDSLERAARDAAQSHFQRGQINVTVQARRAEAAGVARVNLEAVDHYLAATKHYVDQGQASAPSLDGLLALPGVLGGEAPEESGDNEAVETAMVASLGKARHGLKIARDEEGAALAPVLAARADVREELDRLTAHVAAARTLLADDGAVGRRLDFLSQEFMREANTLCSKSATIPLTAVGLELKAAIEQFREQVQNVE